MSARELKRVEVFGRVAAGTLTLGGAATLLDVSYRQTKRLWLRFRTEGAAGLAHRSLGRPSNRRTGAAVRTQALALIRAKYSGDEDTRFGPTLAAEHLASEDGLVVPRETLRRWMRAEGLWSRARKRGPHRQRRERKGHFGELVQMDGSFHQWFEERGPQRCLMTLVDDATGRCLGRLGAQETIWAAAAVLRQWIERYGSPVALYTDWKNVYVRKPTADERVSGIAPLTQFGRMCATLGIQIIPASSPQAKGRVERNHGTHQDRLVKKLRRLGIATDDAANAFLETTYFPEHNRRFAVPPRAADDFHTAIPAGVALDDVFRLEETRVLGNDWVVRYRNRFLQVARQSRYTPARGQVQVLEWPDGRLAIHYRARAVAWRELPAPPIAPVALEPARRHRPTLDPAFAYSRPSMDHPWRRRTEERDVPIWQARDR